MREIKFRAWHTENKKMFSAEEMASDQLTLLTTGSLINVHGVHTHLSTIYDREKFIPLQYTGFRDKNGVEIYEGDILRICNGSINGQNWMQPDKVVTFDKGAFDCPTWSFDSTHWIEVIGNIYQNPELIQNEEPS